VNLIIKIRYVLIMEKHLTEGERILYSTKISRRSKIPGYILMFAILAAAPATYVFFPEYSYVSIILLALGILLFVVSEILLLSKRLYVTNQAVTERAGILSKKMTSIDMEDVINIIVTQSVWQRMLKYGKMHINTGEAEREEEIVFPAMANPYKVKKIIEESFRKREYYTPLYRRRNKSHPKTDEHSGHDSR
jgi:uncharacterized membrane protein YdbT with pleckstrin-like domain